MVQRKIRAIILKNELANDHLYWINACTHFSDQIIYREVDLTKNNWLSDIQQQEFDILLAKPGGLTSHYKELYDERIYILERCLDYKIYPSADEIFIYENKRFLSFWLDANCVPHPRTWVFYEEQEAIDFIKNSDYPFVAKVNIGASGSGVVIIHNIKKAVEYVKGTFKGKGAKQRSGPNLAKGDWMQRGIRYLFHPKEIISKYRIYLIRRKNLQRNFVIFQEYIPHGFEWRVVRIGDSFFAHKKLKVGDKASGSLLKEYDTPPLGLLDFVREITDKHHFYSQAIDIIESKGAYLVNEMQCIFGQSDPHQMLINGIPGRYRFVREEWVFEEGDFNKNESYNLRVQFLLSRFVGNQA